ncbi:GIY-YIG nuclease family protein [Lactococcus formosensis]|uniref:GIY-YIG nuclease family protein n=1 Tax=Lactococcus formosensis TaxID=1281486 RepID=UPI0039F65532
METEGSNRFLDTYLQAKLDLEILGKQKLKNMSVDEIQSGFEDINVILSNMNVFQEDFTGIYILHNYTKNRYYVGQGKNVNRRMLDHFTKSKSKNSILKDYKQGDMFEYKQIKLIESGFDCKGSC